MVGAIGQMKLTRTVDSVLDGGATDLLAEPACVVVTRAGHQQAAAVSGLVVVGLASTVADADVVVVDTVPSSHPLLHHPENSVLGQNSYEPFLWQCKVVLEVAETADATLALADVVAAAVAAYVISDEQQAVAAVVVVAVVETIVVVVAAGLSFVDWSLVVFLDLVEAVPVHH